MNAFEFPVINEEPDSIVFVDFANIENLINAKTGSE
jgi:hypothetical protein